jgi:hypothetical protein
MQYRIEKNHYNLLSFFVAINIYKLEKKEGEKNNENFVRVFFSSSPHDFVRERTEHIIQQRRKKK